MTRTTMERTNRMPIADAPVIARYAVRVDVDHRPVVGVSWKHGYAQYNTRKLSGMALFRRVRQSLERQYGKGRVQVVDGTSGEQAAGLTVLEVRA